MRHISKAGVLALGVNLITGRPLIPTTATRMLNLQGSQIAFVNDKLLPSQEDGRPDTLLPVRGKRILQHVQYQGIETGSRTLGIGTASWGGCILGEVRLEERS